MPNWTYNKIECKKKIADKILTKDESGYILDFNKILPMPKSLNLTAGSIENVAVACYYISLDKNGKRNIEDILENNGLVFYQDYWNKYNDKIREFTNDESKLKKAKESFDGKLMDKPELHFDSLEELGKRYVDNISEYGFAQWYDWCSEVWGTKWNVMEDVEVEIDGDNYSIYFETAWSVPYGIVEEYSKMCSDDEFYWDYTNEDYDGHHYLKKENNQICHYVIDYDKNTNVEEECEI